MSGPVTGPPKYSPGLSGPLRLGAWLPQDPCEPVRRVIHNHAERAVIGVLDHQDDRFVEIRVKLMRGHHQKMALQRFHVHISLSMAYCPSAPAPHCGDHFRSLSTVNAESALVVRQIPHISSQTRKKTAIHFAFPIPGRTIGCLVESRCISSAAFH